MSSKFARPLLMVLIMVIASLTTVNLATDAAAETVEEDQLVEAGINLVALRNDTLDTNQDGEIDAIRVVVVFDLSLIHI